MRPKSSTGVVACPHCQGVGITEPARSRSSRGWPAVCQLCGEFSYNRSRALRVGLFILADAIVPGLVLFLWFAGQRALAIGICASALLVGFLVARWPDPPIMRPVTREQSRVSRNLTYAGLLVLLAVFAAAFVYVLRRDPGA
jgi:hypothetical protein